MRGRWTSGGAAGWPSPLGPTRLPAGAGNHALARWLARDPVLLAPGDRLAQLEAAGPVEAARVFHQLEAPANAAGKVYVELPAECALLDAAEVARLKPRAFARKEQAFAKFATDRAPRFAAMSGAADTTTRRTAAVALSAFDAGRLTELRAMQAALGGEWDIKDPIARDAVLAALQLEAATDADGDLLADRNAVHKRVVQSAGMELTDEWCGIRPGQLP